MNYPRRNTAVFKVLESLVVHGDMNVDQIIDRVGYVMDKSTRYSMTQLMKRMLNQGYIVALKEKYTVVADVRSYVEDVIEFSETIDKGEVVQPPYRNAFTPELKNYNLFAHKRGYERIKNDA